MILDLPEPWRLVKHAEVALHRGGIFVAYLPTIGQVAQLREALDHSGFGLAETIEVLQRGWHVEGQSVRPDHRDGGPHRLSDQALACWPPRASRKHRASRESLGLGRLGPARRRPGPWAAVGGFRLGFLARAVSWLGLGIGLLIAGRALPWAAEGHPPGQSTSRLLLAVGTLILGAVIGQVLGLVLGARLNEVLPMAHCVRWTGGSGVGRGGRRAGRALAADPHVVLRRRLAIAGGQRLVHLSLAEYPVAPAPDTFAELRRLWERTTFLRCSPIWGLAVTLECPRR